MTIVAPATAKQEWSQGWTLVLAAFLGFSFLTLQTGSLTIFMGPLSDEFGWSRTFISSGFTIATVFTALLSPIFGLLVDRYGSRKLALPGIIATACAISLFSLADGSHMGWILLWIFYAIISIAIKPTIWTAAVAGVFSASQGLAVGVALTGMAITQVIVPPLANWLIDDFGWRLSYVILGVGWGVVTLLFSLFFLFDVHDRWAKSRTGERTGSVGRERTRVALPGLTIRDAWRSKALWCVAGSTFIILTLTSGLSVHTIAILGDAGISRGHAALLASLVGVAAIAGKIGTGLLLDRFSANWIGGLTLAAAALAFGLLIDGIHTPVLITIAMVVNGYTQGAKFQICSYLTARYGGMKNFGSIYGFMNSLIALGGGIGPLLAGMAYDISGGYGPFLLAGVAGSIVAGIALIALPGMPVWEPLSDASVKDEAVPAQLAKVAPSS